MSPLLKRTSLPSLQYRLKVQHLINERSKHPETLHLVFLLKMDGCVLTEESCSVGLPLGVEYERKKQRLQQELRLDYRRYMAQVTVRPIYLWRRQACMSGRTFLHVCAV